MAVGAASFHEQLWLRPDDQALAAHPPARTTKCSILSRVPGARLAIVGDGPAMQEMRSVFSGRCAGRLEQHAAQ